MHTQAGSRPFVYSALVRSAQVLQKLPANTRHMRGMVEMLLAEKKTILVPS